MMSRRDKLGYSHVVVELKATCYLQSIYIYIKHLQLPTHQSSLKILRCCLEVNQYETPEYWRALFLIRWNFYLCVNWK